MRIRSLHLKNYRQHADSYFDLADGLTGILGTNGEGKSTIVEAIGWLLFGVRAVKGGKSDIRWDRAPSRRIAEVHGTFDLGGKAYRIWRSESDAKLYEGTSATPIAETTSGVDAKMPELLGMGLEEFLATYLCQQKELSRIADMKGTPRRNFFLQVMGVGRIIDGLKELRERKNELKNERAGLLLGLGERAPLNEERGAASTQVDALEDELAMLASRVEETRTGLTAAEAALSASSDRKAQRDAIARDLDRAEGERARAEQEIMRLFSRELEARQAGERVEAQVEALAELPGLRTRRDELRNALAEERSFDNLRAQLARAQDQVARAKTAAAQLAEHAGTLAGLPDLRSRRDQLREARANAQLRGVITGQVTGLEKRIADSEEMAEDARRQIGFFDSAEHERVNARLGEIDLALAKLRDERERERHATEARRASLLRQEATTERKIEAILGAGVTGDCPTCLRELGEAFQSVLDTLEAERESLAAEAEHEARHLATVDEESDDEMELEAERDELEPQLDRLVQFRRDAELAQSNVKRLTAQIEVDAAALEQTRARLEQLPEVTEDPDALQAVEREIAAVEALDASLQPARATASQLDEAVAQEARLTVELASAPTERVDPDELGRVEAQIAQLVALDESLAPDRALAAQREEIFAEIERWQKIQGDALRAKSTADEELYLLGFDEADHAQLEQNAATSRVRHQEAETNLARCEEMLRGARERLGRAEAAIADYDRRAGRLRAVEEELRDYEETDTRLSEFRAEQASTIRPEMEELTSGMVSLLTDGRFESCTINEDFEVTLQRNGVDRPTISGGEEDIVALAQRIAVSQMIAERAGHPLSLLILDEPFGHLSEARLHNVLGLIRRLKDVFQQVLIISHLREVQDAVDQTIHVSYDEVEGRSHVRALTATEAAA